MIDLIYSLFTLLQKVLRIYMFLIIICSLLTWVAVGYHPIIGFLYKLTNPYLNYIRRYVPTMGGLDFSPMIAIFLLYLLEKGLYFLLLLFIF